MMVNVCIKKPILVLPCLDSKRVLVVQTDFNYMMMRENEEIALIGESPSAAKKFVAHELELYTCNPEDLISKKSFENVKKRRILEPFQVVYSSLEQRASDRLKYDTDIEIEKLTLIVSHQDLYLMGQVMNFQNEMLQREDKLIKTLEIIPVKEYKPVQINRPQNKTRKRKDEGDRENTVVNLAPMVIQNLKISSKTNYYFGGVNVMIINDGSGAYSPVIEFGIGQFKLKMDQNGEAYNMKAELDIRSSYYNPFIDAWEPFIEMFLLSIETFESPLLNPRKQVVLLLNPKLPLNINLTEIMMKHTLRILSSWSSSDSKVESKEVVSPLCVVNNTGCSMKV